MSSILSSTTIFQESLCMRWISIALCILAQGLLTAKEHCRTIYALIACDTITKEIRPASLADIDRMTTSLKNIASQTGLKLKLTLLSGNRLSCKSILEWVDILPQSSSDIVLFYYSGHGLRFEKCHGPWPSILLNNGKDECQAVDGESIEKVIQKKDPRLGIVFFDCCNNVVSMKSPLAESLIIPKSPALPGLKALFLDSEGMITACAAAKGEVALSIVRSNPTGGIFTSGLLYILRKYGTYAQIDWNHISHLSTALCAQITHEKQHPYFKIAVKKVSKNHLGPLKAYK